MVWVIFVYSSEMFEQKKIYNTTNDEKYRITCAVCLDLFQIIRSTNMHLCTQIAHKLPCTSKEISFKWNDWKKNNQHSFTKEKYDTYMSLIAQRIFFAVPLKFIHIILDRTVRLLYSATTDDMYTVDSQCIYFFLHFISYNMS